MTALRVGFLGDSYRKRSFTRRYQHFFRNPKLAGGLLTGFYGILFLCFYSPPYKSEKLAKSCTSVATSAEQAELFRVV